MASLVRKVRTMSVMIVPHDTMLSQTLLLAPQINIPLTETQTSCESEISPEPNVNSGMYPQTSSRPLEDHVRRHLRDHIKRIKDRERIVKLESVQPKVLFEPVEPRVADI
jgi:hypothetical protein